MVDPSTALSVEKNGKNWKYVFLCEDCGREIRRRKDRLSQLESPGCCRTCGNKRRWSEKLRPFESLFNRLKGVAKYSGREIIMTFEEFLEFTRISVCSYCDNAIQWSERGSYLGGSRPYNLDRKVNTEGYSKENCVVACGECNRIKGDKYSYEEMLIIGKLLKELRHDNRN